MNEDQATASEAVSDERKPSGSDYLARIFWGTFWGILWFLALVFGAILWAIMMLELATSWDWDSVFGRTHTGLPFRVFLPIVGAPVVFVTSALAVGASYLLTRQKSGGRRHLIAVVVVLLTYLITGVILLVLWVAN